MGSSGQLSGQIGGNTFLDALEGMISRVYLATHSNEDKIVNLDARRATARPQTQNLPEHTDTPTRKGRSKKPNPAESLLDLRLPADLFGHFIDLLKQVGYELKEEEIPSDTSANRQFNYVKKRNAPKSEENIRYLIYIPAEIFTKPDNSNLIKAIYYDFYNSKKPTDSYIIVFSNSKKWPDLIFRDIIEQKRNRDFQRSYVPWDDIQLLDTPNLTQKKNTLATILLLPSLL